MTDSATPSAIATPRTDSSYTGKWLLGDTNVEMVLADFARQLERELAVANTLVGTLKAENIKLGWSTRSSERERSSILTYTDEELCEINRSCRELAMAVGNPAVYADGDKTIESETIRFAAERLIALRDVRPTTATTEKRYDLDKETSHERETPRTDSSPLELGARNHPLGSEGRESSEVAGTTRTRNECVAPSTVEDMVPLGTISECPSCEGEGWLHVDPVNQPGVRGPCWRCGGSKRVMAYRETEEQFQARMKKLGAFVAACDPSSAIEGSTK